ncbi:hypothetical protein [Hydrogenophaga pseudoflava]|uniref:hypothetical protein n=1 Tax=Hydrogenophaga pseudoflava TaxID=47421 RepID=UPI0027E46E26|nr:hypothetical protein [Hydrogenophaga pseudoflava]MDQ7745661.1 hypothetical protein [Hydrogenophaga pseudoflava]
MSTESKQQSGALDLAELHSSAAAAFSYEGVKEARQRAATLLGLLIGGGGALGGFGLSQWDQNKTVAIAALVAAVYWFCLAANLAYCALRTATVRSWHTVGLVDDLPRWERYASELAAEGESANGLDELRKSAVRNMERAAAEYRGVSTDAFRAIDWVYLLMALTPVVSLAAALLSA